jgi:hypothetical protein
MRIKRLTYIGDPILSLDEAKSYLNREGFAGDDNDITRLIKAAQGMLEAKTSLFIQKGTGEGYAGGWYDQAGGCHEFGRLPILSIDKVEYKAEDTTDYTVLGEANYELDDTHLIPMLAYVGDVDLPNLATDQIKQVKVGVTIGHEAADNTIEDLKQMVAWLVVKMYVYRDDPPEKLETAVNKWLCTRIVPNVGGI